MLTLFRRGRFFCVLVISVNGYEVIPLFREREALKAHRGLNGVYVLSIVA